MLIAVQKLLVWPKQRDLSKTRQDFKKLKKGGVLHNLRRWVRCLVIEKVVKPF